MSKTFTKIWFGVRFAFCGIVALVNSIAVGLQGNGNFLLTGMFIGLFLGVAWSVLLVFGLPALVRDFHLSLKVAFYGALLVAALVLLPIISSHLWGYLVYDQWPNPYQAR
ncbi:MAG TPA: hypothetical protein VIK53_00840 [Verrucomicrobiae bacterium]